jgi:hypothetical protein
MFIYGNPHLISNEGVEHCFHFAGKNSVSINDLESRKSSNSIGIVWGFGDAPPTGEVG